MPDSVSGVENTKPRAFARSSEWLVAQLRSAVERASGFFKRLPDAPMAVWLVAAIGLVATSASALAVSRVAAARDAERFEHFTAETHGNLSDRLETYLAMLRAAVGYVKARDGAVDRESFRRFVGQLKLAEHYPGIQGIGISVRLPGRTVSEAEASLGRYDAADLRIYPPRTREEYHAIVHLEPLDRRNAAALGYDMFSEPVRRMAMERARDTGTAAASGIVELVQEIDEAKQAGFLIYLPVYRGAGEPTTVMGRRDHLIGFVYSPFRANDLMRGIFGDVSRPRLHFEIYDGEPSPQNLLHRSPGERPHAPQLTASRELQVAGRTWTVHYETLPAFEISSGHAFVPFVFFGGLASTALLTWLAWLQAQAKRDADASAAAARASARELEILHDSAARLSAELDRDQLLQTVTDAGRELCGAEIGAFFYNVQDEAGESYLLFALSGAPREAFAAMGMPRNTALFATTFRGEAVVRSDDISTDPRFGRNPPHHGFPKGHWPVRSYLALPVVSSSGRVHGGLFFGHSQIGMFKENAERPLSALAWHAAIALDNAALFKASQDEIAARKLVEEQQKLLLDELNHRVKNTLATVQSIAAQTLRYSPDQASFRQSFERRLIALSEAHNLLARSNWRGASLADLAQRELAPYESEGPQRITTEGDPVWLPPAAAVAFGMVIHELATNAARHGALSWPSGRVQLAWSVEDARGGQTLHVEWREMGGPPVRTKPERSGFGTRLIERSVRQDLQGEAKLHFEPEGLRCVIRARLPATARVNPAAAAAAE